MAQIAVLILLPDCGMYCGFCVSDFAEEELSYDQAVAMLDTIEANGIRNIVLGGGDPFRWSGDTLELSREAQRRGFLVQVCTNAVALPQGFEQLESVDRFVVPLESASAVVHDSMRIHPTGHHAKVVSALEMLKASGKSVTVSSVVTKKNAAVLPELADWLCDYSKAGGNLHAWHLYRFLPYGRFGSAGAPDYFLEDAAFEETVAPLKAQARPFSVFLRRNMLRSSQVVYYWREDGLLHSGSRIPAGSHQP